MRLLDHCSSISRWAPLLFACFNIGCGVPIMIGTISSRRFVPILMSQLRHGAHREALQCLLSLGPLAGFVGITRVVGFWQWRNSRGCRLLVAVSYAVEASRDALMLSEGLIGKSEAVALLPASVLCLASLASLVGRKSEAGAGRPKQR